MYFGKPAHTKEHEMKIIKKEGVVARLRNHAKNKHQQIHHLTTILSITTTEGSGVNGKG